MLHAHAKINVTFVNDVMTFFRTLHKVLTVDVTALYQYFLLLPCFIFYFLKLCFLLTEY